MKKVKGFKGFKSDLKCRDFQYEVGKTYNTDKEIEPCSWGFHFCKRLFDVNDYYAFRNDSYRFCEVEALGKVIDENNKTVTDKIKIVREIPKEEFMEMANVGNKNIGFCNTGDRNTGDSNTGYSNTGDWNTGYSNTGYSNTGDRNTGDSNTGYSNTGDSNTGDSNTGYSNTGDRNTGDRNTGYSNTGDRNTGDSNTGYSNTGDRNTGDWNTTNRSSGVFCTEEPKLIIFNKKTDMTFEEWRNTRAYDILLNVRKNIWVSSYEMTEEEKIKYPSYETCGGYLKEVPRKEASKEWWDELDNYDKNEIFSLPNFNLKVFNEIMELSITRNEHKEVINSVNK